MAQMVNNLPAMQKTQVQPLGWEGNGEGNGNPFHQTIRHGDKSYWMRMVGEILASELYKAILPLQETVKLLSTMAGSLYIPPANYECFSSST